MFSPYVMWLNLFGSRLINKLFGLIHRAWRGVPGNSDFRLFFSPDLAMANELCSTNDAEPNEFKWEIYINIALYSMFAEIYAYLLRDLDSSSGQRYGCRSSSIWSTTKSCGLLSRRQCRYIRWRSPPTHRLTRSVLITSSLRTGAIWRREWGLSAVETHRVLAAERIRVISQRVGHVRHGPLHAPQWRCRVLHTTALFTAWCVFTSLCFLISHKLSTWEHRASFSFISYRFDFNCQYCLLMHKIATYRYV